MPPRDELPESVRREMQLVHRFSVGGHNYGAHVLSALEQIHMARRLAPIVLSILKPESGRGAVLQRLAKVANLTAEGTEASPSLNEVATNDAIDLALSVLQAAADADEEMINSIIRKCMKKIWRLADDRGGLPCWTEKSGFDVPTYKDIDGFITLRLVATYLALEFKDRITEYIATLNLKPGPAFTAAMANAGIPQPPGAPAR